jgi:transposase
MLQHIRVSEIINMDETRVQVLKEDGKTAESLSYMWVLKTGSENKKLTVFHYDPSRSAQVPLKLLNGFKGYLQTDGYEGYSKAVNEFKLVHVGCLAHVRRKFVDAHKANRSSKQPRAVSYISAKYTASKINCERIMYRRMCLLKNVRKNCSLFSMNLKTGLMT